MAKLLLHNLKNVNTVLSMLYDKDGNYRAGFSPDEFYNTILLDTLKYGEENYVHLKYAESLTIKKGYKTARFRRWAGMTPTLRPLLEGVPPAPDKHAYETLEIGNVWSFGRWSEYTDQVDNSIISDIISERSKIVQQNHINFDEMKISELLEFIKENPSVLKRPIIVDTSKLYKGGKFKKPEPAITQNDNYTFTNKNFVSLRAKTLCSFSFSNIINSPFLTVNFSALK